MCQLKERIPNIVHKGIIFSSLPRLVSWRALLPSLSMRGMVMKVMVTMIAPTPRLANLAWSSAMPADLKNVTA